MKPFLQTLHSRVVLFDGPMGTEIYNRGIFFNRCYDEINLSKPEMVADIHRSYLDAGAEVITTNSFGANRIRLTQFGLESHTEEINRRAVEIAKTVAKDQAWVAGSIGPIGVALAPIGKISPGEACRVFNEQAQILASAGVDFFMIETFTNLPELWQAVRGVRQVSDLPIVASMTFPSSHPAQEQVQGTLPETAVRTIEGWGVDAIGAPRRWAPR